MLTVVTGGSGSGKSAYAEQLVLQEGDAKRYYIATMRPWDEECVTKIKRHRIMRAGKQFETVECYGDLHTVPVEPDSVVLLECMSNLVADEFYRVGFDRGDTVSRILKGVCRLRELAGTLIIVTNEVFSDGGPYDDETRAYQEALGEMNRRLGQMADQVTEVVYGIPVKIRGGQT